MHAEDIICILFPIFNEKIERNINFECEYDVFQLSKPKLQSEIYYFTFKNENIDRHILM